MQRALETEADQVFRSAPDCSLSSKDLEMWEGVLQIVGDPVA
jgi:hypothetical protein